MPTINLIAELERYGQEILPQSEDEVKIKCPFHDDQSPSCAVNIRKNLFKCHAAGCGKSGDDLTLLAGILTRASGKLVTRALVYAELSTRYELENVKAIDHEIVEAAHQRIWSAPHLLKELYLRGVTDQDIRRYRLGESKGRITIPIPNVGGTYVNVRHYLPGAPGAEKMKNTKGRSKPRLYPIEQLRYDRIVVTGGEMKAIVGAGVLNPHGWGCLTVTGGEGTWDAEFTRALSGKHVVLLYDIDDGGKKATQIVAPQVRRSASSVCVATLPLDADVYPTGDLNDFVATEKGDLLAVVESAKLWRPPIDDTPLSDDDPVEDVKFTEAMKSVNVGKRMRFTTTVTAASESSYVVPKRVRAVCDKSAGPVCAICPVFSKLEGASPDLIPPESPAILEMMMVGKEKLDTALKNALSVPQTCRVVSFDVTEYYDVEDTRVNPAVDVTNRDSERTMQPAVFVGCGAELNKNYSVTARLYPHPKTQQGTLVVGRSEAAQDSLSQYKPKDLERFLVFRPTEWTTKGVAQKFDDIYNDIEANVTRIFMRRDLHLFIDFAFHSPLLLTVDGKITKGWVEVLIVGDNGQGKSEVATHLMRHYGLGEVVDCKNASVPGLLGGVQQFGTEWFVSWGALPTNDMRLLVMEELKGASTNVISHLTQARSSGVAEITKVKKRKTRCRVRLVAISNPRENRQIADFSFPVECVPVLIGAPEDIRRFDAALIVAAGEIDASQLTQLVRRPPSVEHVFTGDLCRELVLWSWTRRTEQVVFDDSALDALSDEAARLSADFVETIPLIDRATTRSKLARLAASVACRTFSTHDEDFSTVRVRDCHVEFVSLTLHRVYSSPHFGYLAYSHSHRVTDQMTDHEAVRIAIQNTSFPDEMRRHLIFADVIDIVDIQDWMCTIDRQEAQSFLSLLVRCRAIKRHHRHYKKTPDFIRWLKTLELKPSCPEHVRNEPQDKEKF